MIDFCIKLGSINVMVNLEIFLSICIFNFLRDSFKDLLKYDFYILV